MQSTTRTAWSSSLFEIRTVRRDIWHKCFFNWILMITKLIRWPITSHAGIQQICNLQFSKHLRKRRATTCMSASSKFSLHFLLLFSTPSSRFYTKFFKFFVNVFLCQIFPLYYLCPLHYSFYIKIDISCIQKAKWTIMVIIVISINWQY